MRFAATWLFVALLIAVASGVPAEPEAAAVADHSTEEINEAREEFDSIDTNKDGHISREEILEMDEVPERDEIDEFFNTYDANADNRVTFEEILAADDAVRHLPCVTSAIHFSVPR